MFGSNQAGKGDKVSYHWKGITKISERLGQIFKKKKKMICSKCKKQFLTGKIIYNNDGTKTYLCKECNMKKIPKRAYRPF